MLTLLNSSISPVWLVLMAGTGLSLWTAVGHGVDEVTLATCIVMGVAFVKTRFVGMHFMELRHAPFWLRAAFHTWYTGGCALVLGIYLLG